MVRGEAGGTDRDSAASLVSLVVVMLAACGAIFGGDVDVEGFTLLTDDAVVDSGICVHEGLGLDRCEEGYPHGFRGS